MDELPFSELVDRARRGDSEAARQLIEQYETAIRREVRFSLFDARLRRLLDETDVCQSVMGQFFFGLWAGRFDLERPEQLVGLLKEMVRNKVVDRARYWKAECRDYRRTVSPDPDRPFETVSPEPSPSRIVADAELLTEVERRLSDDERTILDLRRQGVHWAEIADRLPTKGPKGQAGAEAVRKRFERALTRVGDELGLEI